MQFSRAGALVLVASAAPALSASTNPLDSVLALLDSLSAQIQRDDVAHQEAYGTFMKWCKGTDADTGFELKSAQDKKAKLEAIIAKAADDADAAAVAIEDLAASIAQAEAELKSATAVRTKEVADFQSSEAELTDSVDTVSRALGVLQREMQKRPGSFAQLDTSSMQSLANSLSAVVDAASLVGADKTKLMALVQSEQADSDDEMGAPAGAVYKSKSGNIVDVLDDLREKAEEELSKLRKAESSTKHNYNLLKQSLTDQIDADKKSFNDQKSNKAQALETKARAEGDLANLLKDIADIEQRSKSANADCGRIGNDHVATVASRKEELQALAEARAALTSSTSGAVSQSYSFLQVASSTTDGTTVHSKLHTQADLKNMEVVMLVKRLAKKEHSATLMQLASQISAVMRFGISAGVDPFAKVKSLISAMIAKLESEAGQEATEKSYCDEEMAKTEAKKQELDDDISTMSAKMDKASSASATLKREVQQLQSELAELAKSQAEMDNTRRAQNKAFVEAKPNLEQGIHGVRKAISVLRAYYGGASEGAGALLQSGSNQPAVPEGHEKAVGAGNGIVGMLEVVESDFTSTLATAQTEEDDEQSQYETYTHENKIAQAIKNQDVTYKTQEFKNLDQAIAELSGDRDTASNEQSAVLDYGSRLKERCIAKPETYEERSRRREAEIAGLKDALKILEDETAFVQRKRSGRKHPFLGTDAL